MLPARRFNGLTGLPDFFNDFFDNGGIERISTKAPAINVIEDDKQYKIEVATPGMTKDDFKVHINKDGNLVIEMEKQKKEEENVSGRIGQIDQLHICHIRRDNRLPIKLDMWVGGNKTLAIP